VALRPYFVATILPAPTPASSRRLCWLPGLFPAGTWPHAAIR